MNRSTGTKRTCEVRFTALLLLAFVASCDEQSKSLTPSLVDGHKAPTSEMNEVGSDAGTDPDAAPSDDEEAERIRKMQMIRIVAGSPGSELTVDIPPHGVALSIYNTCATSWPSSVVVDDLSAECQPIYPEVRCLLQTAGTLLEIAGSAHAPTELPGLNAYITPQPAAPRFALALLAAAYTYRANDVALQTLQGEGVPLSLIGTSTPECPGDRCQCDGQFDVNVRVTRPIPGTIPPAVQEFDQALGSRLAGAAIEGYHLLKEATERLGELGLAAADAQRSDTSSVIEGTRRQMTAAQMSRAHLAHLLVGGDAGLYGGVETPDGLCAVPDLTPSAQRALSLLREGALSPIDLLDPEVSLEELIDDNYRIGGGGAAHTYCGSLRERLYQLWRDDSIVSAPGSIAARFGLERGDFLEARDYLAREIKTFSRSMTAEIEPGQCNDEDAPAGEADLTLEYPMFAATRSEPTPIDPIYWSTLLRYSDERQFPATALVDMPFMAPGASSDRTAPLSLAFTNGIAGAVEDTILRTADALRDLARDADGTGIEEELMGSLHLALSDALNERSGRLYVMRWRNATFNGQSASNVTLPVLWGTTVQDQAIVVRGEDGLRCALYGDIEGATCSKTMLDGLTVGRLNVDYRNELLEVFAIFGPAGAAYMADEHMARMPDRGAVVGFINGSSIPESTRLYVVKPRPGENDSNAGPGEYVAITGFTHAIGGPVAPAVELKVLTDAADIDVYSIVPEFERLAASYIQPNRQWCNHTQLSCAETTFDERLALENELTEGGEEGEDSWRHYLTLARQAADEADLLGQSYLQSEIDLVKTELDEAQMQESIRDRREADLEVLQEICGTSIESDKLFSLLVPTGDIRDAAPHGCTTQAERDTCEANNGTCLVGSCFSNAAVALAQEVDSDPDLYRLQQCLKSTTSSTLAAAGDQYLCVTYGDGNKNRICEANGAKLSSADCPARLKPVLPGTTPEAALALKQTECAAHYSMLIGSTDTTDVALPLGYFQIDTTVPPAGRPVEVCHALRQARHLLEGYPTTDRPDKLLAAVNAMRSDIFFFENVQQRAKDVGWSDLTSPLGYLRYKTADIYPATNGGWPCNGRYPSESIHQSCIVPVEGATSNPSYFCQQINCSDPAQMGEWSRRTFAATVALRAMAYRGSESTMTWQDRNAVPFASKINALDDVSVLAYAPRPEQVSYASGGAVRPPVRLDDFYPDHYLLSIWDGNKNAWALELLNEVTHEPAVSPNDTWMYAPNGTPITTHGYNDNLLHVLYAQHLPPVYYDADSRNKSEDCKRLVPAPLWWKGLELPNTRESWVEDPFLGNSGVNTRPTPDPSHQDWNNYENPYWLKDHLLGRGGLAEHAPVDYLWATQVYAGCKEGRDAANVPVFESNSTTMANSILIGERNALLGDTSLIGHANMQEPLPMGVALIDRAVLDAAELYCHFSLEHQLPPQVALKKPPAFRGVEDLDDAAAYFQEVATDMNDRAAKLLFANLPEQARDALALNPVNSVYPALGGELSEAITELRNALINLSTAAPGMATEIETLAHDIAELRGQLDARQIRREQIDIQQMAESMARASECAAAASPTVSVGLGASVSFNTGAIAICANAFAQIGFSARVADLEKSAQAREAQTLVDAFGKVLAERRDIMRRYADQIIEANEVVNGNLAKIDGLKAKVLRTAARAMYMSTDLAKSQAELGASMRSRAMVERIRYDRALLNAKKLAFLAKRSIEQRIGMQLSEMRDELPLVDAPATWEARACSTTGVDFETFQALSSNEDNKVKLNAFADQYIGDYVTKLENLVESYPLYFNFHEGHDTAVVSLRDDVLTSKLMCDVPTGNLLFHSNDLSEVTAFDPQGDVFDPGAEGWTLAGCATDANDVPLRDCISVTQVSDDSPLDPDVASGQLVEFGDNGAVCAYGNASDPNRCGYTEDAVLRQDVFLDVGKYLLSWYAKDSDAADDLFYVISEQGPVVSGAAQVELSEDPGPWDRFFSIVDVTVPGTYAVVLEQPSSVPSVTVAGVMLEDITRTPRDSELEPSQLIANEEKLTRTIPACEDSFGVSFPSQWRYKCANLCPNGFGAACGADATSTRCFYEATFNLSQREIESGAQLQHAGFASGNFNYRIESLALNFVGTGTRSCDGSVASCFAQSTIPYSISHDGPYYVRNHEGADFEAKLFPGWIEHARGLAAERVITNPVSSADKTLIEGYVRTELRGRPLDGLFTVRVWDEPGVNFKAVEDVQVVLNYGYWTRFK